ncbi:bifunctional 3-(3-hydroxy-phenyl)propionate/3-hydroxycinnamic acid hydroxylase [Nocardia gipuzkoensis]|uniref:bifunctional 3-(3-hydroxy-phenyl)propionate/3-hydroxycinnamic acid hydroxylase n=1 Tax=Nocardia gipuzkoensis TaxID=2749991 RepID=UPI0015EE3968|nr:bifunctional 3-(3-hydroxy-phenyl)propionate/3-hydroxycinnamic acid hydroxylase [Nocardia gipuzkoensis]
MSLPDPNPAPRHTDSPRRHYNVIVVGCGPVGATLANLLLDNGHTVAIIEQETAVFDAPRAMMFDDESDRIIADLGVRKAMQDEDIFLFPSHRVIDPRGKTLLAYDVERAGAVVGWTFHQPTLEALLRARLSGPGLDTYFGYRVNTVTGGSELARLLATEIDTGREIKLTGDYIVGCDGAASMVRRSMGFGRTDFGFSQSWVVVDAVTRDTATFEAMPDGAQFICRGTRSGIYAKGCRQHLRFDFRVTPVPGKTDWTEDARRQIAEYVDPSKVDIKRVSPYIFYAGMPDHWRKGRLLVAGDAAHQTPPFAGQGLNMGLRDAVNLAFKLDLVLTGRAADGLLDTYEQERWKNCATVIKAAVGTGKLITSTRRFNAIVRAVALFVANHSRAALRARIRHEVRKRPYRDGFLGRVHKLSGSLMDSPYMLTVSGDCRLDQLIGNDFVLLTAEPAHGAGVEAFRRRLGGKVVVLGLDAVSRDGELEVWLHKNQISAVVVRPDKYVFDAGNDPNELCERLLAALDGYASTLGAHPSPVRPVSTAN